MSLFGLDYDLQLLENILNQLDITLSTLRDDLRGTGNKTLTDLDSDLSTIDSRLYNSTDGLSVYDQAKAIRGQTDKLTFDSSSYLYINAAVVANPSNLDKSLSSIFDVVASEFGQAYLYNSTDGLSAYDQLKAIRGQTDKLTFDSNNYLYTNLATAIPAGTNVIGGVFADFASAATINGTVGTSEVVGSAIDVRRGGRKVIYIDNSQDVDITVTIEGSYDGTNWYTIRDGISVASGTKKVGILRDAYGYVRAKAVASTAPSSGSVVITVSRMT